MSHTRNNQKHWADRQ